MQLDIEYRHWKLARQGGGSRAPPRFEIVPNDNAAVRGQIDLCSKFTILSILKRPQALRANHRHMEPNRSDWIDANLQPTLVRAAEISASVPAASNSGAAINLTGFSLLVPDWA